MATKNAVDKMDMSLDQIIKLQRKESKQYRDGESSGARGRGNRIRGRGSAGGRGGRGRARGSSRPATSVLRRSDNSTTAGSALRGKKKLGVRASLAARRLLTKGQAVSGRGRGRGGTFQRVARNIIKRAIVQNRRLAVQKRRSLAAGQQQVTLGSKTRRLAEDVQRWRNTARQLQRALQAQQKQGSPRIRLRRFNNTAGVRGRQQATSLTTNIHQRLGWRRTTAGGRGALRRGRGGFGNQGRVAQSLPNVKGRGTVGQMQSDLLIQNRQVSIQQRRQHQDAYSRDRRQQRIGQARNLGGGMTASFNSLPKLQVRGRRGRGGNRFGSRNSDFGSSFNQTGTKRPSLNERFGGSSGPTVLISNNAGFRARGNRSRQIFF